MNQQVEVAKLAERHISIDTRGKGRSFECEHANAVFLQQSTQPDHLGGQVPVAQRVAVNVLAQSFTDRYGQI